MAKQRGIALGLSRLSEFVETAIDDMEHNIDVPTMYLDQTDLWSIDDEFWNTKGPQCWAEAPDLCLWFAKLGNRYQAPSSYVIIIFFLCYAATNIYIRFQLTMLSSMPFQRLLEPTRTFIQMKGEGKFNWARNDNIDSILAYMCGEAVPEKDRCDRCKYGNGIMTECVLVQGYMKGACSNCWKNSKQATCVYCKCSFLVYFVTPN